MSARIHSVSSGYETKGAERRGPGFACFPDARPSQEHDMPNRGELAIPAVPAAKAATASNDAWTIISFCVIGWLISIYVATASLGIDAVPRLMEQFPGLM
jgi:hypothetical protein